MRNLSERFIHARDLAAQREADIRLKELIRAISIEIDYTAGPNDPWAISAHVHCHNRGWNLYMPGTHLTALGALDNDALANEVAGWIQGAIEHRFLTLSDPPRG